MPSTMIVWTGDKHMLVDRFEVSLFRLENIFQVLGDVLGSSHSSVFLIFLEDFNTCKITYCLSANTRERSCCFSSLRSVTQSGWDSANQGQALGLQEQHFLCMHSSLLSTLCPISQASAHHFLECLDRVMHILRRQKLPQPTKFKGMMKMLWWPSLFSYTDSFFLLLHLHSTLSR